MERGNVVGGSGDAETAGEGARGLEWGLREGLGPALSK